MEGIFSIRVMDEIYDISPLYLPPHGIHYGVCKNGALQFVVQRIINYEGDNWGIAYPYLNINTPRYLVDSIIEKIHAYFT